jgi:hypothetical protein
LLRVGWRRAARTAPEWCQAYLAELHEATRAKREAELAAGFGLAA